MAEVEEAIDNLVFYTWWMWKVLEHNGLVFPLLAVLCIAYLIVALIGRSRR